jgi:hypothetical protein
MEGYPLQALLSKVGVYISVGCLFHKLRNLYTAIHVPEDLSAKQGRRYRRAVFKDFHANWHTATKQSYVAFGKPSASAAILSPRQLRLCAETCDPRPPTTTLSNSTLPGSRGICAPIAVWSASIAIFAAELMLLVSINPTMAFLPWSLKRPINTKSHSLRTDFHRRRHTIQCSAVTASPSQMAVNLIELSASRRVVPRE